MRRTTNEQIARLVETAALGVGQQRRQARRTLLSAIVRDGRTAKDARTLVDRFLSEARGAAKDVQALATAHTLLDAAVIDTQEARAMLHGQADVQAVEMQVASPWAAIQP